jgi:hypothetical protein
MMKFNRSNLVQWNVARWLLAATVWMFAAFLLAPAPFAATRYVSPTGADVTSTGPTFWQLEFNSCSDQGKPCKTIYWAVKMAQNGDVISVAEGHYVETITVSKNLLFKGAGGYLVGAPLTWVDGNKQDNVFKIELGAPATIQSMLISNGKNGISNAGSLAVEECLVGGSERTEVWTGSGIYNDNGNLGLRRVWLLGNKAYGLLNHGSAALDEVWIFANEDGVRNGTGRSLAVGNSVIWNNKRVGVVNEGKLTMLNVTISGNGDTGLEALADVSLSYVTITANGVQTNGNGISTQGGSVTTFANSIVYGNGPAGYYQCGYAGWPKNSDGGYNVFADTSCSYSAGSGSIIADPKLKPLNGAGSFTLTHALTPGSPAIDLVPNSKCVTRDQRNVTRPVDGNGDGTSACDAGAYNLNRERNKISMRVALWIARM